MSIFINIYIFNFYPGNKREYQYFEKGFLFDLYTKSSCFFSNSTILFSSKLIYSFNLYIITFTIISIYAIITYKLNDFNERMCFKFKCGLLFNAICIAAAHKNDYLIKYEATGYVAPTRINIEIELRLRLHNY